ncbi:MAG TPA: glycosyltransferase [Actinomycetota bacterium]
MGNRDEEAFAKTNGHRGSNHRVLIYSHDTYGLGHLRRSLLVAEGLAAENDAPSVLIATGSPRAQAFDLPPGCDTVKLPAVTKASTGEYRPRTLGVGLEELIEVRAEILRAVAQSFSPDLILVDHSPVGMSGELWPLFDDLGSARDRPRMVLGLRDITDDADAVQAEWARAGAWDAIERLYDRILVYGDPALTTTAQDLGLTERFSDKVRLVGYLGRSIQTSTAMNGQPNIVVTAGGGGDGHGLLSGYLSFLERLPARAAFRSTLVTGPFLSRGRQREIRERCRALDQPVEVVSFTNRFEELLSSAAGVVSMAGYNTVVEILATGVPALLVPRVVPRREQLVRARRLAALDGDSLVVTDGPNPDRIGEFVERVIGGTIHRRKGSPVQMDGLSRTVAELREMLGTPGARLSGKRRSKRVAALA